MAKNFWEIAFTKAVKELQARFGSRANYARMEAMHVVDGLDHHAEHFITDRDSFYMATVSESGYPYIQHRWGPKGFLKVLNRNLVGFIDYAGNRQYVSVGNLATNDRVSLIMVDYPSRSRLKILARAEVVELADNPALYSQLEPEDKEYAFRAERMVLLHIEAYDWNCPQHIVPRYTMEEIEDALASQRKYITEIEEENARLKAMVQEKSTRNTLGDTEKSQ